ncbi:MAG: heparan-alpha-glucosaminide N-acetyltransferase domain-containing protein, partial [Vicinamibacteria bacterium]
MTRERLVSVDAFRGATVAGMILVNNPGDWGHIYWPLEHAPWNGWTPTDLIFPFFLFLVGASLAFSTRDTTKAAAIRALKIFGLGFFMAFYPRFNVLTVRIPGVLARIALCYFVAFLIKKYFGLKGVAAIAAACCLSYWFLMTVVPVPGGFPPNLEPETNLGAWLDRLIFGQHLWVTSKTWDPEGLLSSLPAVGTTLFGYLAGSLFRAGLHPSDIIRRLSISGFVLTVAGLTWNTVFPINKSLWTSSYVLFTAGLASILLAGFYWVADVKGHKAVMKPFVIYGVNAIVVFVTSGLLAKTMGLIKLPLGDSIVSSQVFIYRVFFLSWLTPFNASL